MQTVAEQTATEPTPAPSPEQETRAQIVAALDELPADSLQVLPQFVAFLQDQARQGRAVASEPQKKRSSMYPTVPMPASSLDAFIGILSEGYEGDALKDTEALYDEVLRSRLENHLGAA